MLFEYPEILPLLGLCNKTKLNRKFIWSPRNKEIMSKLQKKLSRSLNQARKGSVFEVYAHFYVCGLKLENVWDHHVCTLDPTLIPIRIIDQLSQKWSIFF